MATNGKDHKSGLFDMSTVLQILWSLMIT